MTAQVTKVPPLKCPNCNSEKVSPGFNKRIKNAFVRDGKIWCYDCGMVTSKDGKMKKHDFNSHDFGDEGQR